jgi:hypothetical protein
LGAIIPCLLGYSVIRSAGRRAVFAIAAVAVGVGATALSAALSWGPAHAWAWLSLPVQFGLALGAILALVACRAAARLRGARAAGPGRSPELLNQAPASAYFAQTLQTWEQGRFIRFNGLANGWAGCGLTRRWLMCWCGSRAATRKIEWAHERPPFLLRTPHLLLPQRAHERRSLLRAAPCPGGLRPLQGR